MHVNKGKEGLQKAYNDMIHAPSRLAFEQRIYAWGLLPVQFEMKRCLRKLLEPIETENKPETTNIQLHVTKPFLNSITKMIKIKFSVAKFYHSRWQMMLGVRIMTHP